MPITRDEDVLGGEPRIEGTRVGVRHVAAMVVDGGRSPAYVADQLDIGLSSVYEALAYYYDNVDEIRTIRADNDAVRERARDESLKPKEFVT